MSNFAATFYEHADPALVTELQTRLAKLKPACTQCGRVLAKAELDTRRCREREDCRLRQIFAGQKFTLGKPLALAEIKARRKPEQPVTADGGFAMLPPACLRCGRKLPKRDLAAGRECLDRDACTKRIILSFRAPNFLAERYAKAWADERKTPEHEEAIAA